jgi:uncharacterized protein
VRYGETQRNFLIIQIFARRARPQTFKDRLWEVVVAANIDLIDNKLFLFFVYLNMIKNKKILLKIKQLVNLAEPSATVILFGSQARGKSNKQSDIDILILVDIDKITYSEEQRIKYPLYDLEFETGKVISPVIFSRNDWETRHFITPFYKNIKKDGVLL